MRRGVGATQDEALGTALIEAAADAGSPVGLSKLGGLFEEGASGYPEDAWRAAQCFERAAETGSALGLFNHGWALVHGIGTARDVERGLAQWRKAAARAPDDGSEEAAYYLYEERSLLTPKMLAQGPSPSTYLQLSATLGFEKARKVWRANEKRKALGPDPYGLKAKAGRERFIRDDKARAWTAKETRTEKWLDGE